MQVILTEDVPKLGEMGEIERIAVLGGVGQGQLRTGEAGVGHKVRFWAQTGKT